MKKLVYLLVMVLGAMFFVCSCDDNDSDGDKTSLRLKVAVRVDSRPPRSVTLFGGEMYLGEGHEDNWVITQEYYRLYEDVIKVKESDIFKIDKPSFKSNSDYASSFLKIDYPYDDNKVFSVTVEETDNYILLILK